MIFCGEAEGGKPSPAAAFDKVCPGSDAFAPGLWQHR